MNCALTLDELNKELEREERILQSEALRMYVDVMRGVSHPSQFDFLMSRDDLNRIYGGAAGCGKTPKRKKR